MIKSKIHKKKIVINIQRPIKSPNMDDNLKNIKNGYP